MPIPDFNYNNVLPPHLGDPRQSSDLSPYSCTILELCQKFSTSPERIKILKNFILFRERMTNFGIINGFQWLDGSFLENIEASESRPPKDLDVVTFYTGLSDSDKIGIASGFIEFISPSWATKNYLLDHYAVDYGHNPDTTVEMTRYWLQLFTHNRNSVWKGMLRLPLNTQIDDQSALKYLNLLQNGTL